MDLLFVDIPTLAKKLGACPVCGETADGHYGFDFMVTVEVGVRNGALDTVNGSHVGYDTAARRPIRCNHCDALNTLQQMAPKLAPVELTELLQSCGAPGNRGGVLIVDSE